MQLSIIIPTLNEEKYLPRLIRFLRWHHPGPAEIIVSDGGSTDATPELARASGAIVVEGAPGRAGQMNRGAARAQGDILYFVHADIVPPASFYRDIRQKCAQGKVAGRYAMWFASRRPTLMINALFSHLNLLWCSGGDQTFFIQRSAWEALGGFDQRYVIMEEYDLMQRLRQIFGRKAFTVMHRHVRTTDRKYRGNGYWKVNRANLKAFRMWRQGKDPREIQRFYRAALFGD